MIKTALVVRLASVSIAVALTTASLEHARAAPLPDSWITLKAKVALMTENQLTANDIHVDTVNGHVTLYGKVNSNVQKRSAADIAVRIKGVRGVRNLLEVVGPGSAKAVAASDGDLNQRVREVLEQDPGLKGSAISVKSVDKGAVLLGGSARTLAAHLNALQVVGEVPGVRSVASEVKTPEVITPAEVERAGAGAKDATHDSWTTADVKLRLLADPAVPALDINVDTYHGIVSLFGMVSSAAARSAAVADARKAESVVGVSDDLQVVRTKGRKLIDASDDLVKGHVKAVFKDFPQFSHVEVDVKNGQAHLTGTVPSGWDRLQAAVTARTAKGVRAVDDDLHLEPPPGCSQASRLATP